MDDEHWRAFERAAQAVEPRLRLSVNRWGRNAEAWLEREDGTPQAKRAPITET